MEAQQDADIADIADASTPQVPPIWNPDISSRIRVAKWQGRFQAGSLKAAHFKEHWRIWVPRIYGLSANDSCLNWSFDEDMAKRVLFETLEVFICDGEPQEVIAALNQLNKPPSVCGRVFKMGEPTYSCRECGMDPTCVLCIDCFKRSEHRHHRYKMSTSHGGGCCDCGDVEAWKKAPFCDIHLAGCQTEPRQQGLPKEMADRALIVFDAVLWYAYELLTVERTPGLPADLRIKETDSDSFLFDIDTFCTVLYNDETHTFEQVISTLNKVVKCSQKNAVEFVTNVDREGRAVVKCSNFQHCNELREQIEKMTSRANNKPIKVLVMHAHMIAHQLFALKLLSWLQNFLAYGEGFRNVFTQVALASNQHTGSTIVDGIMVRDSKLWKSARTHWHRLLISGMLMEYESKKALANIFTKHYGNIMQDFIQDDHEHSFSVTSLSVQIFTVPTIAHHLIGCQDALYILLNAFNAECSIKCNKNRKLEFERNPYNSNFKRAQYMLVDLRYLLGVLPDQWTNELKKGFLHGLTYVFKILTMMQGMDAVSRQVGQHMEYEPEWESAFNLHIRLAQCLTLALDWCGSDEVVLKKAYWLTLKNLHNLLASDAGGAVEVRELADHSVACIMYDVAAEPVSIHLPLTRFLAGLHLNLHKYGLSFSSVDLPACSKPTPEQIIEPVLRTQVMIAQVHAGMWRRNGYALLNQLFFYHNVKCRSEMLDRDIVILQMGAALIESNEFLIHVLNKFNLLNWAGSNFEAATTGTPEEETMRQTTNLVEEFLQLLITIVGERYMPGVGQVTQKDRIKKEIIQQLCIKPLSHSELAKSLQDDSSNELILDDVIEEVAEFRKPSGSNGKGVYVLRPDLYDSYDVFFYHYTREEWSKSEEAQRKRRKQAGHLECCPPPQLPLLAEPFTILANLLQCDVMLHIMQTVLARSADLRARSFSELQLHRVLHLVGYALQEEQSKNYPFLNFCERAKRKNLQGLLEELSTSPRVEAHKDLIAWTLGKYKQVAQLHSGTPEPSPAGPADAVTSQQQASDDEKSRRSRKAAEQRAKVLAQMKQAQAQFVKENAKLFEEAAAPAGGVDDDDESAKEEAWMELCDLQPVALGPRQTPRQMSEQKYTCILCQEEERVSATSGPALVLAGFVQQSTVLSRQRDRQPDHFDHLFLTANLGPALHTSTCGHVMHAACWKKYFDNVVQKEHRRTHRLRHSNGYDLEKNEFLCPLCECLSNTVLPLVPPLGALQVAPPNTDLDLGEWLQALGAVVERKAKLCCATEPDCEPSCSKELHQVLVPCSLEDLEQALGPARFQRYYQSFMPTEASIQLSKNIVDMMDVYVETAAVKVSCEAEDARPLVVWKTCAYTVHTIEFLLRDADKALLGDLSSRQRDCLESMVRIIGSLGLAKEDHGVGRHAIRLLSTLLENPSEGPSILDWDSFGLLVSLTFALPCLFGGNLVPSGLGQDLNIFRLMFVAHTVKILLTMDVEALTSASTSSMDCDDAEPTAASPIACLLQPVLGERLLSDATVWQHVKEASRPFLRCCVLFYHYVTDVPAPPNLLTIGGDTFEDMCEYLGVEQARWDAVFAAEGVLGLVANWCAHKSVAALRSGTWSGILVREPIGVNQLVDLPQDYSELINTVSLFTCPNSDREDSRNPTMCLVCGEMLCSQSYCCQTKLNRDQVGACSYHAHTCGAGVGIFLRVRECEIIFLSCPHRGCSATPPYLDEYGETDQGLRRGNPLHLCRESYKKLHTQWLSHSILEEIARVIESGLTSMITPWQHM